MSNEFDINRLLSDINDSSDFASFVNTAIHDVLTSDIQTEINNLNAHVDSVNERLFTELDRLTQTDLTLDAKVSEALRAAALVEFETAAAIEAAIAQQLTEAVLDIENAAETQQGIIRRAVVDDLQSSIDFGAGIADKVTSTIQTAVSDIERDTTSIISTISAGIDAQLGGIGDLIEPAITKATDVAVALRDTLPDSVEQLGQSLPGAFGSAIGGIFGPLTSLFELLSAEKWGEAISAVDSIHGMLEEDPFLGEFVRKLTPDGLPPLAIVGILTVAVIVPALITSTVSAVLSGPAAKSTQFSMSKFRPQLMNSQELRELKNRGLVGDDVIADQLSKAGFPDESIGLLSVLRQQNLGLVEVLSLWRRNLVPTEQLPDRLERLGFIGIDQELLKQLAFAIPGIQDIILFAVREVFDIETATRFGQFEGVPPEVMNSFNERFGQFGEGQEGGVRAFIEFAKQAGLDSDFATAYWASHWRLPGVTSLFDMVHRLAPDIVAERAQEFTEFGLDPSKLGFTLEDLDRTLRAQDFTPAFRERLTAIAFRPITRVDVRRMHKLGLVDDRELVRRYRELGYSPSDAELMGAFTVDFNTTPDEIEDQETKDLTRTQILKFMEKGFLDREDAVNLLVDIGYTPDVSEAFVSLRELDIIDNEQQAQIKIVRERFKAGLIDFNQATTALDPLLLPALQRDAILADFEAELASRVRAPSLGNLKAFAEAGLIERIDAKRELEQQGFAPFWSDKYIVLWFGNVGEEAATRDIRAPFG